VPGCLLNGNPKWGSTATSGGGGHISYEARAGHRLAKRRMPGPSLAIHLNSDSFFFGKLQNMIECHVEYFRNEEVTGLRYLKVRFSVSQFWKCKTLGHDDKVKLTLYFGNS
jgi:hypothetical protein